MAIHVDNIAEKNHIYLINLNGNGKDVEGTWYAGSVGQYGHFAFNYKLPMVRGHYYYGRAYYKFTATGSTKPTSVALYSQGGSYTFGSTSVSTAGTEYMVSGVCRPGYHAGSSATYGNIYAMPSGNLSGVTSYTKNCVIYDITELYDLLRSKGAVTTDAAMKTWCDTNLIYTRGDLGYDVTSLVTDTTSKLTFHKGETVVNEVVEGDGMCAYSVSTVLANNCYFDSNVGVYVYNNKGGSAVTHTRVSASAQNSPFANKHPYVLKITTNGEATPGAGGFVASHNAAANKVFVEKFIAKIPVNYKIVQAYNSQGSGASVTIVGNDKGTGDWEEYTILYRCGSSGSFSSGGHVYLSPMNGASATSVTWYLAYVNNCDITGKEYLQNFTVWPNKWRVKNGVMFTDVLDNVNLIANGNGSKQEPELLRSGWTYDTTDVAGNAVASIVQPVGAGWSDYGPAVPVDPTKRYKVSFWVKCKRDMTSFLTAVRFLSANGTDMTHSSVHYISGTKTTLAAALKPGDTTVSLTSGANWIVRNYSRIGFRKSNWSSSWNDMGTSNGGSGSAGIISAVNGNTLTLATGYTGTATPAGTCVVESFDGGTWPYPIQRANLPTDNTWKYVEGYFGSTTNACWDGNISSNGSSWPSMPAETTHVALRLNIYANDGSVPIKYADIRIEPVSTSCNRNEEKIQINEVN